MTGHKRSKWPVIFWPNDRSNDRSKWPVILTGHWPVMTEFRSNDRSWPNLGKKFWPVIDRSWPVIFTFWKIQYKNFKILYFSLFFILTGHDRSFWPVKWPKWPVILTGHDRSKKFLNKKMTFIFCPRWVLLDNSSDQLRILKKTVANDILTEKRSKWPNCPNPVVMHVTPPYRSS